jgi:hypothetical protein
MGVGKPADRRRPIRHYAESGQESADHADRTSQAGAHRWRGCGAHSVGRCPLTHWCILVAGRYLPSGTRKGLSVTLLESPRVCGAIWGIRAPSWPASPDL